MQLNDDKPNSRFSLKGFFMIPDKPLNSISKLVVQIYLIVIDKIKPLAKFQGIYYFSFFGISSLTFNFLRS